MSFRDFDRGISAQEVRNKKLTEKAENHALERLHQWGESEHVLNMLRKINASKEALGKGDLEKWLVATSGLI